MPPSLPLPSVLSSLSRDEQFKVLDTLFEPSLELHTLIGPKLGSGSFSTYPELIDIVGDQLKALSISKLSSDKQMLMKILGSHPRLGRPPPASTSDSSKATAGPESLSELSRNEQKNLDTASSNEQAEMLSLLNHEYEQTFPGLRFVYDVAHSRTDARIDTDYLCSTFVNGRDRTTIMQEMRERIARQDQDQEVAKVIEAMCDIAKDREKKLLHTAHI